MEKVNEVLKIVNWVLSGAVFLTITYAKRNVIERYLLMKLDKIIKKISY